MSTTTTTTKPKKTRTTDRSKEDYDWSIIYDQFVETSITLNYDYTSYATTNDIYNAFLKHFESMIRILAKTFKEINASYLEKKNLSQLIIELFGKNRANQEKKELEEKKVDGLHQLAIKSKLNFKTPLEGNVSMQFNDYNKAIINPLFAKMILIQKLASLNPQKWIGSKYGYFFSSENEKDSYIGYFYF